MKKKTLFTLLAASLLLSSCGNVSTVTDETTASSVSSEAAETTAIAASAESSSEDELPDEDEELPDEEADEDFDELPDEDEEDDELIDYVADEDYVTFDGAILDKPLSSIYNIDFFKEIDGEKFVDEFTPNGYPIRAYTENYHDCVTFSDTGFYVLLRESSGAMEKGENNKSVSDKAKNILKVSSYSDLRINDVYDPVFYVSCKSDGTVSAENVSLGYYKSLDSNFKVRAFVKYYEKDMYSKTFDIIIDPAYMYGIPMFSNNEKYMNFDINGTKVTADTLNFTCDVYADNIDVPDTDGYFYAEVMLNNLRIYFSTDKGYENKADLREIKLITEDTDSIIDTPFVNSVDKDAAMSEVYNAIIAEQAKFLSPDSYGVVLVDLDFDGIPEVLNSHYREIENPENSWKNKASDVDVYRVKNGKLVLTGTMTNQFMTVYDISNMIGLKELPDGTKGWFATSYKNRDTGAIGDVDYVYTLDGDKLNHKEIFSSKNSGKKNEYDETIYDYYYMGEKMKINKIHHELTEIEKQEPYAFEETYEWNGIEASFGEWELYGFAREKFCEDISVIYKLYSDWMCKADYHNGYNGIERLDVTEREFSYKIAYAVDAAFLGSYNEDRMENRYRFLGDYAKPVIYLYPEEETDVSVSLDFTYGGELTCTYPEYNGCWNVTAMPDGTLYDENGDEYYCLYWEADGNAMFDSSKGFCVNGEDTAAFLREKLMYIGLSAREANEFIIYWLPKLEDNKFNVITFHTDDYADSVPLTLSVKPDTEIRVFMTYYPANEPVEIEEQDLPHYERNGFTLVEWGGSEF